MSDHKTFTETLLQDRERWVTLDWLWGEDLEVEEREEVAIIQGLLLFAARDLSEALLDDIRAIARHPLTTERRLLDVLGGVPDGLVGPDQLLFACRLLATVDDIIKRLSSGWASSNSLGQDVGLHLVIEHAETLAELHDLDVEDLHDQLADLFADTDYVVHLAEGPPTPQEELWAPYLSDTDRLDADEVDVP